jgi:curved DNA-binding protein CbpA
MECCNDFFPSRNRRNRRAVRETPSGRLTIPDDGYCFDPYQLLQVRRDATEREIVAGYQRFALLYHPVRSTGDVVLFTAVAAAYETLRDDDTRMALQKILADYYASRVHSNNNNNNNPYDSRCDARDQQGSGDKKRAASALLQNNTKTENDPIDQATIPSNSAPNIRSLLFPPQNLMIVPSASSSSTTLADTQHYSYETTERLFGGPLKLMHQARRFEAFTDPYDLFERVFRSSMGRRRRSNLSRDHQHETEERTHREPRRLPHHLEQQQQQQQQQQRLIDPQGCLAFRQQGNRRLTRTIRQRGDQLHISVTSVLLVADEETERRDDDGDDSWLSRLCCS